MRFGSLFAGIGGFDLGLERAGLRAAWQVEKDGFCQRVLSQRWPTTVRYDDVRTAGLSRESGGASRGSAGGQESASGGQPLVPVDLLVGGFPCQDLSVAGRRAGLQGERSGLFWEIIRIAKEIHPTWGLFENVPGLFSSHAGRDMAEVLEGFRQCWPVVGYRVLDSQYFGVAQRRRRVFFVCGPSESGVAQILFEPEGGSGHLAPGAETRTNLATTLRSRSARPGVSPPGQGGEDDENIVTASLLAGHAHDGDQIGSESHLQVAACLNSGGNQGGFRTEPGEHLVTHPLRAAGFDGSEDGTGRGMPIVVSGRDRGDDGRGYGREPHISFLPTLDATKPDRVFSQGVRRLTPTECERLQGFPDGWTCLCQPLESYDPMACTCPDGPRYRALGNAVTVNVIEWLGARIIGHA